MSDTIPTTSTDEVQDQKEATQQEPTLSSISTPKKELTIPVPNTKDLLKAGVQFGHETKRWNPKMKKYIFGEKNNIHVIDINQTENKLKEAVEFLRDAASRGNVLFIGTKRQASQIIKEEAIRVGAYFINMRWAGGLLTNFSVVKKSLIKLTSLEQNFEEGIEDRTKYEVSRMKKEWQRLDRLYSGIKNLSEKPTAAVIIDTNFEKSAVKECKKIRLPIVALADTNSDPDNANYIVPANDDAIGSIKLLIKTLADGVLAGNKGNGIKHVLKNYVEMEIKITKPKLTSGEEDKVSVIQAGESTREEDQNQIDRNIPQMKKTRIRTKGILEKVKDDAESVKTRTVNKEEGSKKIKAEAPSKVILEKPAIVKAKTEKVVKEKEVKKDTSKKSTPNKTKK